MTSDPAHTSALASPPRGPSGRTEQGRRGEPKGLRFCVVGVDIGELHRCGNESAIVSSYRGSSTRSTSGAQRSRAGVWLLLGATVLPAAAQTFNLAGFPPSMTEGQTKTTIVALSSAPSQDLTVTVSSNNAALAVMPATLTFTPTSWAPKRLTLEAVEDDDGDWAAVTLSVASEQWPLFVFDNQTRNRSG